jgi:CBS domain-containing protein
MPTHRRMSDIIRRTPVTLPPAATVQQACQAMHQHRIGAVMVVDEDQHLLGIFTGRDLVRLLAEGRNPAHTHLRAVMTKDPSHLSPGHNAADAMRLMHDGGFRHVPVVEQGRVVGVVSHGDLNRIEGARWDEVAGI